MRLLILASLSFLTACAETELIAIPLDIPGETLTPCPISERQARTVNELAMLNIEHRRSAECANGKIVAIAEIVEAQGKPGGS